MAFNPFEAFSIRSKLGRSVMAIIGIVVMLTFVLSSGAVGTRNDFFDQIGSMFNSKKRGDVVAVAYGNDVHDADLSEIRRQRQAASDYMNDAVDTAYSNWAKDLERDLQGTRISADTRRDIERFVALRAGLEKDPRPYQNYLQDFFRFGPESQRLAQAMSRAKSNPDSEDKRALDAVAAILLHDLGPRFFLVELRPDSDRDLLDFYLLLKKADQLGIRYSPEGVKDLIRQDTLGRFSDKDGVYVEQRVRKSGRYGDVSSAWIMEAIGNEYRARSALAALQGRSPVSAMLKQSRDSSLPALLLGVDSSNIPMPGVLATASAMPGAVTPYEFFEFYKDKCSEHSFNVLDISAETFLPKVTEEPTKKELSDLYNKHRGDLPDPSKDRPGFKDPRKIKLEFVGLSAADKRIKEAMPKLSAANQIVAATAAAIDGNPMAALLTTARPTLDEALAIKQLVNAKREVGDLPFYYYDHYRLVPRDSEIYQPQVVASILGGFAGQPCATLPITPLALAERHIEIQALKTRVPFHLQAWLTSFSPTMGNALGMPAFAIPVGPKPVPDGMYLAEATQEIQKRIRQELFQMDMKELNDKLNKIQDAVDKPDKAKLEKAKSESKKLLSDWCKERGLTPVGNKEPSDQYALAGDPDLKPLNDLATKEPDGTNSLVKRLFSTDPRTGQQTLNMQPFYPFWFPGDPAGDSLDKTNHYVWISEELEPKTVGNNLANADIITNGEMTKRVTKAWKLEKARALAKAEADKLAEQVRIIAKGIGTNSQGVDRQLRDLAAERSLKQFDLLDLAILKQSREATRAGGSTYKGPEIDRNKVTYPTPNFAEQLLELRKQSVGGVTVLADSARNHYYVACEVGRSEKTVEQFRDEVFTKSSAASLTQDPLYERYAIPEERLKATQEVLQRLRADAKLEEKEAFKNREKREVE